MKQSDGRASRPDTDAEDAAAGLPISEACVAFRQAGRRYGRSWALRPTSFALWPGRILGVVGPNGAGKTTLLSLALGLLRPTSGEVVTSRALQARGGAGFGAVLDQDGLLLRASARANLRQWGALLRVDGPDDVERALGEVGLEGVGERRVGQFSLGMRRRLALARALLAKPSVLVLDEPANGLDPSGVRALRHLMRERAADGTAIMLSSHSLSEVDELCDQIVYLDSGHVTGSWTADDPRWWRIRVAAREADRSAAVLANEAVQARPEGADQLYVRHGPSIVDVLTTLRDHGVEVCSVTDVGRDLERPFRGSVRQWEA